MDQPGRGLEPFPEYAAAWIDERPNLRPKTIRLYRYLLRAHLRPGFESKTVAEIKEANVRRWRKGLLDGGASAVTTAKAYRLLKAILNTAVYDGLIRRNPCRIRGAGQEKSPERPTLTIPQVYGLARPIANCRTFRAGPVRGNAGRSPRPGTRSRRTRARTCAS